jgi:DNA modification methylase
VINTIVNIDCLKGMKILPDKSIDMILCDLPYGTTECNWDTIIPFNLLWRQYERLIKDNGAIVLTAKQPFTTDLIDSNRKMYRYNLVWAKNISSGFLNAKIMPLQSHEDIAVFYKSKPCYNPQMITGQERKVCKAISKQFCKPAEQYSKHIRVRDYDSTERYPKSILYFSSDKHVNALHPTQKPVALFEYLIRTYTSPGDLVLDNCMGSGTTAIACINTERKYIGFELNPEYYNIAIQRIADERRRMDSLGIPLFKAQ